MNNVISKELYIEVFKPDTSAITLDEYDVILEDEILYLRNRHTLFDADEVCVYKAQHKCKEWALTQGYVQIKSEMDKKSSIAIIERAIKPDVVFYGNTEPEAIFKACQWILDNKEPV